MWGSTLVFASAVQVITGLFLWMCYSPSNQGAWESVYYIQHEMVGGWFLRGLHHFMAQAMIVLLVLHLMQVVIDGAYRAPREVNFWLGLILMLIVLSLSLTGYLLPWDQKGYWATRVATNLMGIVPVIGPQLQKLVVGGERLRQLHAHAILRPACRRAAAAAGGLSGGARRAVPPARPARQGAVQESRHHVLARPGAERRRGLPRGAGSRGVFHREAASCSASTLLGRRRADYLGR